MLHPRSYGLSPLTQYGGTVGGIWFWHWSMVFVCRGSWWTVAPYTPTPVPGDEAGVAVGELSTMERDWAQDLSLSLFVIQFTEYFYCLQTFAFAHTHSAARKRCRIYYCSLHKLYYLTSLSFHNERIHIRFHPRVQCVIISVELLLCEVFQLVFLAKLDQQAILALQAVWIMGQWTTTLVQSDQTFLQRVIVLRGLISSIHSTTSQ